MNWKKTSLWTLGIALVIVLFFSDNIWGYYRFKSMCEREGGLRINQPLERDVGWTVNTGHIAYVRFPLSIQGVAFVRYRNKRDGLLYDVYRVHEKNMNDDGYVQQPADSSKPVIYEYRLTQEKLRDEIRMTTVTQDVIDLRTGSISASYKTFGYSEFEPSRTPLAAPSGISCPRDVPEIDEKTGETLPSLVYLAFSRMFKN